MTEIDEYIEKLKREMNMNAMTMREEMKKSDKRLDMLITYSQAMISGLFMPMFVQALREKRLKLKKGGEKENPLHLDSRVESRLALNIQKKIDRKRKAK